MVKNNIKLIFIWRKLLVVIFIYSAYHSIRDILSDIFNIHSPFTEFLHYRLGKNELPSGFKWMNFWGLRKWMSFPVEIFLFWAVLKVRKSEVFTRIDLWIFIVIIFSFIFWGLGFLYS